jgi:hypothetical protein
MAGEMPKIFQMAQDYAERFTNVLTSRDFTPQFGQELAQS